MIDNIPRWPPPASRHHLCTFCGQEEGDYNDWSFLCCADCYPELSRRLHEVVDVYEAEVRARHQEQP